MKFRRMVAVYGSRFRQTDRQGVELAKILASDPRYEQELASSGRGPLSGPDATPFNIGKLVLALLGDGPQPNAPAVVANHYHIATEGSSSGEGSGPDTAATPDRSVRCKITGKTIFGDAVTALLSDPKLAAQIERILIRRDGLDASIIARDGRSQRFVDGYNARQNAAADERGDMLVEASIGGRLLTEMARDISE